MNKRSGKNKKNAGPGGIVILLLLIVAVMGLCVYVVKKNHKIEKGNDTGAAATSAAPEATGGTPLILPTPTPVPTLADRIAGLHAAEKADTIFLVAGDGTPAGCEFYAFSKEKGEWKLGLTSKGYLGSNGINYETRKEGDRTTPGGLYKLALCFGIAENPGGLQKEYYRVTEDDYWDSDVNSDTYNQLVKGSKQPASWDIAASEHLIDYREQYKYAVQIAFNTDPIVKGNGSAIFLHCTRTGGSVTAGCVAIPEADMLQAMRMLRGEAYILIVKDLADIEIYNK